MTELKYPQKVAVCTDSVLVMLCMFLMSVCLCANKPDCAAAQHQLQTCPEGDNLPKVAPLMTAISAAYTS